MRNRLFFFLQRQNTENLDPIPSINARASSASFFPIFSSSQSALSSRIRSKRAARAEEILRSSASAVLKRSSAFCKRGAAKDVSAIFGNLPETKDQVFDPLQTRAGGVEPCKGEIELRAVMGRKEQIADLLARYSLSSKDRGECRNCRGFSTSSYGRRGDARHGPNVCTKRWPVQHSDWAISFS